MGDYLNPLAYIVLCYIDYGGSQVEGVFIDKARAEAYVAKLQARGRWIGEYVVEEWYDGETR